jgi:hypothetical protein
MGIPIGKLSLYTAFAGIDPSHCLPVQLDVGTNNRELLEDPLYLGWNHERIGGETYDALVEEFVNAGLSDEIARRRLWFVDVDGLVVKGRSNLMSHNLPYAHDHDPTDFLSAIHSIQPHVLIGATGHPNTFTKEVVSAMAALNPRPVIFALSNPTSRAECTPEQAYRWSEGRAIFASGSPFAPVELETRDTLYPGQGNNAYVFPGIGLGAIGVEAERFAARSREHDVPTLLLSFGMLRMKAPVDLDFDVAPSNSQREHRDCGPNQQTEPLRGPVESRFDLISQNPTRANVRRAPQEQGHCVEQDELAIRKPGQTRCKCRYAAAGRHELSDDQVARTLREHPHTERENASVGVGRKTAGHAQEAFALPACQTEPRRLSDKGPCSDRRDCDHGMDDSFRRKGPADQ